MYLELSALKKNLKKDASSLPVLKVALLGDNPTQLLSVALKGYAINEGYNLDLYEAEYNQIDLEILNQESELYEANPRFVLIFQSTQKLLVKFYKTPKSDRYLFAQKQLEQISNYIENINSGLKANIIFCNFPEIDENVFGNYANKTDLSFIYQLRKLNYELMNLSGRHKNFFINDLALLHIRFGLNSAHSPIMLANSNMIYTLDFLPVVAKNTLDIIKAINGKIKKCLIMDLDNTLWGGVIGDDGLEGIQIGNLGIGEAYTRLQKWAKELKERGIILAVCSKNDENNAKEPFEKHPEIVLKLEDIAVFVANWNNKADNIRYIQQVLNIGFDSLVFIDDNPAERKIVRDNLPEVTVPELPDDPAYYLDYLQQLNLFETASSVTDEDGDRTRQYQEEAKRVSIRQSFVNEDAFLQSLDMICTSIPFNKLDIPRVAQLTQRSNQFNLRTVRYTDEDINKICSDENYITRSFKLSDTFGEYGLVSLIILKKINESDLLIDTWIMSCRVLKRGLEQFALNEIVTAAKMRGFKKVIGEYIPTTKNGMVKEHYPKLGFSVSEESKTWFLDLIDFKPLNNFINRA
jgi:FkbH-like protein